MLLRRLPQFRPGAALRACAATAPGIHGALPVSLSSSALTVTWPEQKESKFHYVWLRDHCRCELCFHPVTKQRLLDTFQIPADIKPESIETTDKGLTIDWGNHLTSFSWSWLRRHSYYPKLESSPVPPQSLWGSSVRDNPPVVKYDDVMAGPEGLAAWTALIQQFGFAYIDGVPKTPEATEKLLSRAGCVRNTHYGPFWDFTADLAKADTAYTDLEIGLHTDTTYFSEPAGLQMFHLLEFTGEGGESLFADGFRAAKDLEREDPTAFELLKKVNVPAHCIDYEDVFIQPEHPSPIIQTNPKTGQLEKIRWNNCDRSTLSDWDDPEDVTKFYEALGKWNQILNRPSNVYKVQLEPGRPIIFDNWRILHGRKAFQGHRRLCGGYVTRDDYISTLKVTNSAREHLMEAV